MDKDFKYFLPYQLRWMEDAAPLKIMEKSRQIGLSYCTALSAVCRAAQKPAPLDVWVSSRDLFQAKMFIEDCKIWAKVMNVAAFDLGTMIVEEESGTAAHVLQIKRGTRIYSLSSNPNALAGKRGHVILDEFALHEDQALLYRVAKPVVTWGGQLEIISTHRGPNTVFNDIIRDITERGNPMGWSHHKVTLQDAIEEGLVERINRKTGREESREAYAARIHAECLDEEQWLQEYCCVPCEAKSSFISYELVAACEEDCLKDFNYLQECKNPLYLGMDVGRKQDLTVMDVGEKIGDVVWDRLRIEMHARPFAEQEHELRRLLTLPQMQFACLDATGIGMQLAERAKEDFGWMVEPVTFTAPMKEQMAYGLKAAFEERSLRIPHDNALRDDLRGVKKEITASGNIRFAGESADSHCDRFWAKALRHYAMKDRGGVEVTVG